ncbi:MAG: family peptidase [Massilia sp.]|nr:family peptidase [Massilia sp.]
MPNLVARMCQPALAALFLLLLAPAQEGRAAALPPIARFFESPVLSQARLSPSGKFLAARSDAAGRRDYLVVVNLDTGTAQLVAGYADADIGSFQWVNDERLVFDVTDKLAAPGERRYAAGLFGVDRDGKNLVQLAERRGDLYNKQTGSNLEKRVLPWHTFMLDQAGAEDSEYIYVESPELDSHWTVTSTNLLRLNTVTGRTQRAPSPGKVDEWLLDNKGEPRLATGSERGTTTIHYRDPATGAWRVVGRQRNYGGDSGAFVPVGFGADGTLYVTASAGQDTSSLHTFNLATGKINPEPVLVTRGYDFDGALVRNRARLLGVRLRTDAESTAWFDPAMQAVQQRLDKLLPGSANLVRVASGAEVPWVLVESWHRSRGDGQAAAGTLQGTRRPGHPGPLDIAARRQRQGPAAGRAGTWRALSPWRHLGLERANAVPGVAWLRGAATGVPWQYRVRMGVFPGGVETMGPGDAGRYRRRRALGDRARHRRSTARLHRGRQLRRLFRADEAGQRSGTVQVRDQLGRRHRHQPPV